MVVRIIKKGNVTSKEVVKAKLPRLTLRQAKVVAKVGKSRQSKASILREAGYSESVARTPARVFGKPVVENAVNVVLSKMEANRNKIIDALTEKDFTKQSPFNLTAMMNMHTKDIELLSGRPTERTAYTLSDEEKERILKLAKLNS